METQHRKDFVIPLLTVMSDAVAIEFSFIFSYWLRFYSPLTQVAEVTKGFPPLIEYVWGSLVVIPVWLFLFNQRGMHRARRNVYFSDEFFAIVRLVFIGMLVVMAGAFFYRTFSYSRLVFGILGVSAVVFISTGRYLVMKFERMWYHSGHDVKRVVLAGTNASARRVYEALARDPGLGYRIEGYFSLKGPGAMETTGARHIGSIREAPTYARQHDTDIILVAVDSKDHPVLFDLVHGCEGLHTEIMMVPDVLEIMTSQVRIRELEGIPFIRIRTSPIGAWSQIVKRAFDIVVASAVLVVTSPLFLLLAVLVKLTSRGPVFYGQERVGLDGRSFLLLKFRSMHVDAEAATGPTWARKDDPRTTRIGKFLRRFSLDELPQLVNVLKGEMSLVGPRPERPHFVEQFRKDVPMYLDRHKMKAGMTGWAQVNGLRGGETSIEDRTKYDVYYVENWSLVFDLKIIFKTIRAVLFAKDAY
ncbi:MAG TPA: undecaprenyl-phosphate glucose phosphotransferase [Bacteroidota bacterium]|nr:undecaprenyl-phosphate glucose phosphotransferase [Bacteroidota bacterium]